MKKYNLINTELKQVITSHTNKQLILEMKNAYRTISKEFEKKLIIEEVEEKE